MQYLSIKGSHTTRVVRDMRQKKLPTTSLPHSDPSYDPTGSDYLSFSDLLSLSKDSTAFPRLCSRNAIHRTFSINSDYADACSFRIRAGICRNEDSNQGLRVDACLSDHTRLLDLSSQTLLSFSQPGGLERYLRRRALHILDREVHYTGVT